MGMGTGSLTTMGPRHRRSTPNGIRPGAGSTRRWGNVFGLTTLRGAFAGRGGVATRGGEATWVGVRGWWPLRAVRWPAAVPDWRVLECARQVLRDWPAQLPC